jgi:phage tail sheath protein FI
MEKDIGKSMKQFMFEPNSETTRTRVKLTIEPYMELVKGKEGIIESLVVCDESNNPYDKQVLGQLIVDLYIKPVFAAEYIILNFTVTKDVISSSVSG